MITQLPALRRYAYGLSGDSAAADDLVQDCVERGIRRLGSLESEDQLGGWLRSILFNVFLDGRRRFRSQGEKVETDQLDQVADSRAGPELQQEAEETLRAIAFLTDHHRQVLLLIAVEGLSYQEAAGELGLPIGTVMSRLARARDALRAVLASGAAGSSRARSEATRRW